MSLIRTIIAIAALDQAPYGHAFTDIGSTAYDRYDYAKEKREALTTWAEWLRVRVEPLEWAA